MALSGALLHSVVRFADDCGIHLKPTAFWSRHCAAVVCLLSLARFWRARLWASHFSSCVARKQAARTPAASERRSTLNMASQPASEINCEILVLPSLGESEARFQLLMTLLRAA